MWSDLKTVTLSAGYTCSRCVQTPNSSIIRHRWILSKSWLCSWRVKHCFSPLVSFGQLFCLSWSSCTICLPVFLLLSIQRSLSRLCCWCESTVGFVVCSNGRISWWRETRISWSGKCLGSIRWTEGDVRTGCNFRMQIQRWNSPACAQEDCIPVHQYLTSYSSSFDAHRCTHTPSSLSPTATAYPRFLFVRRLGKHFRRFNSNILCEYIVWFRTFFSKAQVVKSPCGKLCTIRLHGCKKQETF